MHMNVDTLVDLTLTDHEWHALTMTQRHNIAGDVAYAFRAESTVAGVPDNYRTRGMIRNLAREIIADG